MKTTRKENHFDVYAKFLLDCKKAMGSLDLDRLSVDDDYKNEVLRRVALHTSNNLEQA